MKLRLQVDVTYSANTPAIELKELSDMLAEIVQDAYQKHQFQVADNMVGKVESVATQVINLAQPNEVWIVWGEDQDADSPHTHHVFDTADEINAFLEGVDEACGWLGHTQYDTEDEMQAFYTAAGKPPVVPYHVYYELYDRDLPASSRVLQSGMYVIYHSPTACQAALSIATRAALLADLASLPAASPLHSASFRVQSHYPVEHDPNADRAGSYSVSYTTFRDGKQTGGGLAVIYLDFTGEYLQTVTELWRAIRDRAMATIQERETDDFQIESIEANHPVGDNTRDDEFEEDEGPDNVQEETAG